MACCEALLGRQVKLAVRNPSTTQDRAGNIQAVLNELEDSVLQTDLSHISGSRVVAGDVVDIHSLLEILAALLTGEAEVHAAGISALLMPPLLHSYWQPGLHKLC